jgi:tetratricopeptide (TPR) repeat protein
MTILDRAQVVTGRHELKHFTAREADLEGFRAILDAPEHSPLQVQAIHGVGGVGKSALIERLRNELDRRKPAIPHARFDVETLKSLTSTSREVLLSLRSELESRFRLSFPRFDLLVTSLLVAEGGTPPPLVASNSSLKNTFELMTTLQPLLSSKSVKLLDELARKSKTAERLLAREGAREELLHQVERARRNDSTLADLLSDRFADDLVEGLPARAGKACRGVLFFDSHELLWNDAEAGRSVQSRRLDSWLRQLAEKVRERGVLIVVAGRDELRWAHDEAEWQGAIQPHKLGGLTRQEAQLYLARRGIGQSPSAPESPLQSAILDACSGSQDADGQVHCHPFFLALCADIVDNSRVNIAHTDPPVETFSVPQGEEAAETLVDQFRKSLPNERWNAWINELSLTPLFDESAALDIDCGRRHNLGRAGWKDLLRYSFVESHSDGSYRIHKRMRDLLRPHLDDIATEVHTWFRDHWASHNHPALAFFHRWSLDPEATLDAWLEEHRAAVQEDRQSATTRALLDDWVHVRLDALDRERVGDPLWARTHVDIGNSFVATSIAPRAHVLNTAIGHYEAALQVYAETNFPDWAATQHNLGVAYWKLPTGDHGVNLRRAIECYRAALGVRTESKYPADWAVTQHNLGLSYSDLPTGDRNANIHRAIECYQAALRVRTESAFPVAWAATQNSLGAAYWNLTTEDRGENLRHAIACYESALRVYTESDYPGLWAMTVCNLGAACADLPTGDRGANLQRAIECYQSALRVRTEATLPEEWAGTQILLGTAFWNLPTGQRAHNLRRALERYRGALRVYSESTHPAVWATTQYLLGQTLRETGQIEDALRAFESSAAAYERVGDLERAEETKAEVEATRAMSQVHQEQ